MRYVSILFVLGLVLSLLIGAPSRAAPSISPEYAAVLAHFGTVFEHAQNDFDGLTCGSPAYVRASPNTNDMRQEQRLLDVTNLKPLWSVKTEKLAYFLLTWAHPRRVGFASWAMLPDQHIAFWVSRCTFKPPAL